MKEGLPESESIRNTAAFYLTKKTADIVLYHSFYHHAYTQYLPAKSHVQKEHEGKCLCSFSTECGDL